MYKIYEHGKFIILEETDHYIVVNKTKKFKNGHTHINNYKTALWLIKLSEHKSVPYNIPLYFLESLIRISSDEKYLDKLKRLQKSKLSKAKLPKSKLDYCNKGDYKHGKKHRQTRKYNI